MMTSIIYTTLFFVYEVLFKPKLHEIIYTATASETNCIMPKIIPWKAADLNVLLNPKYKQRTLHNKVNIIFKTSIVVRNLYVSIKIAYRVIVVRTENLLLFSYIDFA